MPETPAQFTRADKGLLGHYLRTLREMPQEARANFATLIRHLSGPGRYLLCALEPADLLAEALAALPVLERTAFNFGLDCKLTPDDAQQTGAQAGQTKRALVLATLAAYQSDLRKIAADELAKLNQGGAAA